MLRWEEFQKNGQLECKHHGVHSDWYVKLGGKSGNRVECKKCVKEQYVKNFDEKRVKWKEKYLKEKLCTPFKRRMQNIKNRYKDKGWDWDCDIDENFLENLLKNKIINVLCLGDR